GFTFCWVVPELAAKVDVGPKVAVMVCVPTVKLEMLTVAWPVLSSGALPRIVKPSEKVTGPAGVPAALVTVAVKATDWRRVDGFGVLPYTTLFRSGFTFCWVVPELAAKVDVGPKVAVM